MSDYKAELLEILDEFGEQVTDQWGGDTDKESLEGLSVATAKLLALLHSETTKARLDELHQSDNYITETSGYDWYPVDFKVYIDDRIAVLQQLFESEENNN